MKKIFILFIILAIIPLVCSASYIFKQNDYINYRFRCIDVNGSYCNNATQLLINIDASNGTNIINNGSMTFNETFFNYSLPTYSLGEYKVLILVPNQPNSTTEFSYEVTVTGEQVSLSNIIIVIVFLAVSIMIFLIGYTFDKDKWILKSGFYLCAMLFGLLAINSAGIISSESSGLYKMSTVGLIFMISVVLLMFLYVFIVWTIQTFRSFKKKEMVRWE